MSETIPVPRTVLHQLLYSIYMTLLAEYKDNPGVNVFDIIEESYQCDGVEYMVGLMRDEAEQLRYVEQIVADLDKARERLYEIRAAFE